MAGKTRKVENIVKITRRAAETLKAIQTVNAKDEKHALRIEMEDEGYGLWLGPEQKGDTWVGSEDTLLLRVTPDVIKLFRKTSMVIDCLDHEEGMRLIVYPEDNPPPGLSKPETTRRTARKPGKK